MAGLQRELDVELASSQPNHQLLEGRLHLVNHLLELGSLLLLLSDYLLQLLQLLIIIGRVAQLNLTLLGFLFEDSDAMSQLFVAVRKVIDVLVQNIHVRQQSIVLLFSLDEGALDLLYVAHTSSLSDLAERLINNLHVPLVAVDKLDLLLIIVN